MEKSTTTVCLVGAGNVATHLGEALKHAGIGIKAVYSRTGASANMLASLLGTMAVTVIGRLPEAQIYIYCVKDDVLSGLIEANARLHPDALHLHTSGSTGMDVFAGRCRRYGVLYPLQTFSRTRPLDFSGVPCFVEGCDEPVQAEITALAQAVSHDVRPLSSPQRCRLHMAAVFASNFVNHCYAIASRLTSGEPGVTSDVFLPLIRETAAKACSLSPEKAQTGPAVRYDLGIMERHLELLKDDALRCNIYRLMSESIHEFAMQHEAEDGGRGKTGRETPPETA